MTCCGFRPLSGSYISQYSFAFLFLYQFLTVSVPYRGATFLNEVFKYYKKKNKPVSVPYRGATFLNNALMNSEEIFYDVSVPYRGATFLNDQRKKINSRNSNCFRPLSGSYISQYHPRNPMSCLGRIGGLRGKSNFIEMQPFWKVKNSHKSSI